MTASRPRRIGPAGYSVVVATLARPSLAATLDSIAGARGPAPAEVIVVDDRKAAWPPLEPDHPGLEVKLLTGAGRGPAAARNTGWRSCSAEWVAFVDDDVVVGPDWRARLAEDLTGLDWQVAGSQARLSVPLPAGRRPTDWQRQTAALSTGRWVSADIAYRRSVLEEVGGFDERFPGAYREDTDLALRIGYCGYLVVQGERRSSHPVRPARPWVSISRQSGNRDDVLMRALHGPGWRVASGAGDARNGRHLATTAAAGAALAGAASSHRRIALAAGVAWAASTAAFAAGRVRPGPRGWAETSTMVATSALIPPVACARLAEGCLRLPSLLGDTRRAPLGQARSPLALRPPRVLSRQHLHPRAARADFGWHAAALLVDRDGTLIVDMPGNTDPDRVVVMPSAKVALRRAREAGLAVGVVTNQSAIGRGEVTAAQVEAINSRVDDLLGAMDAWECCPHTAAEGCGCRKPAPGLVMAAAARLGVAASDCAVIGDVGSDLEAARAAGARGLLVPARATLRSEIAAAPVVCRDLAHAVDLILAGMC